MTFAEAGNYKITFGAHKGKTLFQIARNDEGFTYLMWAQKTFSQDPRTDTALLRAALATYFAEESVQKRYRQRALLDSDYAAHDA